MLNSSVNFIIYCFVGSNFRKTFVGFLKPMFTSSPRTTVREITTLSTLFPTPDTSPDQENKEEMIQMINIRRTRSCEDISNINGGGFADSRSVLSED